MILPNLGKYLVRRYLMHDDEYDEQNKKLNPLPILQDVAVGHLSTRLEAEHKNHRMTIVVIAKDTLLVQMHGSNKYRIGLKQVPTPVRSTRSIITIKNISKLWYLSTSI